MTMQWVPNRALRIALMVFFVGLSGLELEVKAAAIVGHAAITDVRLEGREVIVEAVAPEGVRRVTLESKRRVGAGAWEPRQVLWVDGTPQVVRLRLERSEAMEVLRVRGDDGGILPFEFFQGTNSFLGVVQGTSAGGVIGAPEGGMPPGTTQDRVSVAAGSNGSAAREVVESDIWKLQGERLYFFNQYRGLQVIDISRPQSPVLQGTLEMAAAGEQMYVLNTGQAVLLARDGCSWWGEGSESRVLIADPGSAGLPPKIIGSLPVPGYISESRLVGTALYVASETYRRIELPPVPGGVTTTQYEWGTTITSFDLADPAQASRKSSIWIPRYGSVVMATDRYFFVASQDGSEYWQSAIRVIDISAPDGTMVQVGSVRPAGRVMDKFKMNLSGDVFTVITENLSDTRTPLTRVQTYSLVDPRQPARLGTVDMGKGERLFATRFDGNRVYIVTFERIDPLWVVDLSNPALPTITGELEIPGWSTYIHPMGDRLVAMGVETNRVAVSLFDVHDPKRPALLSKVRLGENYSWSEANYDEKAFTVVESAGLLLVPYQGNTAGGYASRVQLIDLGRDTLTARGAIEHLFQPRRAAVHKDRILSISGHELLSVDASNRDLPKVTAAVELAWAADRVILTGNFVVGISSAIHWGTEVAPSLRVLRADDLGQILTRHTLGNPWDVAGSTVQGTHLYLLQVKPAEYSWLPVNGETPKEPTISPPRGRLSVVDLSKLPELSILAETDLTLSNAYWSTATALWPKPGLLVWSTEGGYWGPYMLESMAVDSAELIGVNRMIRPGPWYGGGGGGRLLVFDVANPSAPTLQAEVQIGGTNSWWGFGAAHAANGLVFMSHQETQFLEGVLPPGSKAPEPSIYLDKETGLWVTNRFAIGTWVQRYFLDVVDFQNPKAPLLRRPVSIPGELRGISHAGAILYATGYQTDAVTLTNDWTERLIAVAYDGAAAFQVAAMTLPQTWPRPLEITEGVLYMGRQILADGDKPAEYSIEAWRLNESGKFEMTGVVKSLKAPPETLHVVGGSGLLAAQSGLAVDLFDIRQPSAPVRVGGGRPSGCSWFNLLAADGELGRGLFLPLGYYGIFAIRF